MDVLTIPVGGERLDSEHTERVAWEGHTLEQKEGCTWSPKAGPRVQLGARAQVLKFPPPPCPLHLQHGVTMIFSSSTGQAGGWNEVR